MFPVNTVVLLLYYRLHAHRRKRIWWKKINPLRKGEEEVEVTKIWVAE
jgi:hypothetical protein